MILDVSKTSSIYTSWEKLELSWDFLNLFHIFSCFTLNCIWHGRGGNSSILRAYKVLIQGRIVSPGLDFTGRPTKGCQHFMAISLPKPPTVFLEADLALLLSNRPLQYKFQPHHFLLFGGNQLSALCFLILIYTLGIDSR